MRKTIVSILLTLLLCSGIAPVLSAEPPQFLTVDELRPGMKGVGKTVFSGTQIEEFDVEILGILKHQSPHGDVIMARVSGGPLPLEHSGVLAGMSGSPIYIDGKLIGALAFIPSIFPKEPMVAGITPIHEMLRDAARGAQSPGQVAQDYHTGRASSSFVPIQTPLAVSGAVPQVLPFIEEQLAPRHMIPVQGGSPSQTMLETADTDLKPGSAVGVQLIQGDMNISAVGTVTYRDNEKILAFGHPMFFAGPVEFPMTAAYVNLTVSNLINSFKLASSIKSVGAITQDRRTGISGMLGQQPPMIPLQVSVHSSGAAPHLAQYTFDVVDHPIFSSLFMKIASLNALLATEKAMGTTTISTRTTIWLRDSPPLSLEEHFTGEQVSISAILAAFAPLDRLLSNQFEPLAVEKVALELTLQEELLEAEITGITVPDNTVNPGETLEATILLRPYGKEPTSLTQSFTIPEDAPQGSLQLVACDGKLNSTVETMRATAKFQPQNLEQLKRLLQEQVGQNTIVLSLFQAKPGVVAQGRELPSPPMSMLTLLHTTARYAGRHTLTRGRILLREELPTPYVVQGCTALELTIERHMTDRDLQERKHLRQGEFMP